MGISDTEFEAIIADGSKEILGDLEWTADPNRCAHHSFRAEVRSDAGWPLFVAASWNHQIGALSFALILKPHGRVYALDLGKDHRNLDGTLVGEKHKHRWQEGQREKNAYVPEDITATGRQPVEAWKQFCAEARIRHDGAMMEPGAIQKELSL